MLPHYINVMKMFSHTKRTFLGKAYHDHLGTRNLVEVETTHYNSLEGRN